MRIGIREPLIANRTYYVRTDGNDNNSGLVNDAAGAFRTIRHCAPTSRRRRSRSHADGRFCDSHAPMDWNVEGVKMTSADAFGLYVAGRAFIQKVEFGACAGYQIHITRGGNVSMVGDYRISGGGLSHVLADSSGSTFRSNGGSIIVTNTPAFSIAFAWALRGGAIVCPGLTFTGSATGKRYDVMSNGVIDTGSGAPPNQSYFPGNAAGTTASGGQYV